MKKVLILTSFVIMSAGIFAQDVTTYVGGVLKFENTEKNIKKNLGKNVTLTYDSFFKSYTIVYTDLNGQRNKMVFTHDGTEYNQYLYNRVVFSVIMSEISLGFAKNGGGFISFSDIRKTIYGGTHITYKITDLKIK